MNCTELSLENLKRVCIEAAKRIDSDRKIDLVIYVAKAGFPIAVYMNEVFETQILGIDAQRNGNWLKQMAGPIVKHLPSFVRNFLISMELKSKVHKQSSERNVHFHESIKKRKNCSYDNILIVDDSVDTGHSMKLCFQEVESQFPTSNVYSYALNVWDQSYDIFVTDYWSYVNTIIKSPMSKDSKEYDEFCRMYDEGTQGGYI